MREAYGNASRSLRDYDMLNGMPIHHDTQSLELVISGLTDENSNFICRRHWNTSKLQRERW